MQEQEKDIEQKEILLKKIESLNEQVKEINKRIKYRNGISIGLFEGLLKSQEKSTPQSEQQKLIQGGEQMKYRGIAIHKNKNCSTWYARYTNNGKQIYISAKTQLDCYNKLKQALKRKSQTELKELREPKEKEPQAMSLKLWYTKWLELYKKDVKTATKTYYKTCINHIQSIINKPLNEITSIDILEIINKIEGQRTKQKVYEFLKDLLNKAKLHKFIQENPLEIIEKPKHKKTNGIALSNEDETKLEQILINQNLDMYLVCLYQGLRRGEMLALTRNDVDFENKTLTINKSINVDNVLTTTKNEYSNRIIPLFDKTYKLLLKYKNVQGRLFEIKRGKCEKTFLNIIRSNFPNKKYTIHSLRHTFITRCQEANIPLHIIQKWVGHNIGSEVTAKVYTHTREVAELENIEKLNNYIKNN